MTDPATTRMSSKGQVVIPEEIRKRLDLKSGSRFVVVGEKDVVILKSIKTPTIDQFDTLIKTVRKKAKAAGLKKSDITAAVKRARSGK